jgi:CBS domain-containing protein
MRTVRDLLDAKGHDVWSIEPEASVFDALRLMADKNIGAVMVIDDNGQLVGILSERDYARKVVLKGQTSRETTVASIMTDEVFCVGPEITLEECMTLMTVRRIRHLPVRLDDRLFGVVSIGDVGKAMMANQEFVIGQLEQYICGSWPSMPA